MPLLAYVFLAVLFAKVVLIGYGNIATQLLLPGLLLAIVALMLLRSARARTLLPQMPFLGPLLLVFVVASSSSIIAALNGFPLNESVTVVLRLLTMIVVSVGAFLVAGMGHVTAGRRVLFATFLVHLIAAIVLYYAGVGYEIGGILRPTGLTGRPQLIANIASLAMVYYLSRMLHVDRQMTPGAVFLMSLGLAFVVISGTLKNFVAGILICVLALMSMRGRYRVPVVVGGYVLLSLAAYLAWLELPIGARLSEAIQAGLTADVSIGDKLDSSLMWRALHWKLLLQDWYGSYMWTGAGIGQVVSLDALKTDAGGGFIAHSDWVGLLVELGPIGFAIVLLAHVRMYRTMASRCRAGQAEFQPVRLAFILFILMSTVGNILYSAAYQYQFWWIAGLAAGTYVSNRSVV